MRVRATAIPDVRVVEPKVVGDERGFFLESWNARALAQAGIGAAFVQDNHSRSRRGVLRGLHDQVREPQGKLVTEEQARGVVRRYNNSELYAATVLEAAARLHPAAKGTP